MKIVWKQNPLETVVELNKKDIEKLKDCIYNDLITEITYSANYLFNQKQRTPFEKFLRFVTRKEYIAKDKITPHYMDILTNPEKYKKYSEEHLNYKIEALSSYHCGDCTCVASSCPKCSAEDDLGINTIEGLMKHAASYVSEAFEKCTNIDDAISYLENYNFVPEHPEQWIRLGGYDQYIPGRKEEIKDAIKWLKKYKKDHFSNR